MFNSVVAFKKFLLFLGVSSASMFCYALIKSDFQSKYNYFLIKSIHKEISPQNLPETFGYENFECKLNHNPQEQNISEKLNKCEIFDLNKSNATYIFEANNFQEKNFQIDDYSKLKNNNLYLLKILGRNLESVKPNENKVSIVPKGKKNSYYDFGIVFNFESNYRNLYSSYLFGFINHLESTNPQISLEANTKYTCDKYDCTINQIEVDSVGSTIKKIKWEEKITPVDNYSNLKKEENSNKKFYILSTQEKVFRMDEIPTIISVKYKNNSEPEKQLLNFKVKGLAIVNFSDIPIRGFIVS